MKKYILIVVCLLICQTSFSQRFKNFSSSADTYISELEQLYSTDQNMSKDQKKEWQAIMNTYDSVYNTFTSQHKRDIIKLSQTMIKKNIRARNGFYDFVLTQIAFSQSNQTAESYNQWLKGMQQYLDKHNIKIYNQAIQATYNLLVNYSLHYTKTSQWTFDKATPYAFRIDEERGVYADFNNKMNVFYGISSPVGTIYSTTGRLYIMEDVWEGHGGKVNWERSGLNEDSVYCILQDYKVALKSPYLTADSVKFANKEYFSYTLDGVLTDKITEKTTKDTRYPKFTSYKKTEYIKNVFENVDYIGGFSQQGGGFFGTGTKKEPARLVFRKDGEVFMVAKAIEHPFSRDGIISEDCQVSIYVNQKGDTKDSIYHPGTKMNYNSSTHIILCSDNKKGISSSPWIDSYHNVEIYSDALYAGLDEHTIEFSTIRGPSNNSFATIESTSYYSDFRWYKIKGIDDVSPLYRIKQYTDEYKTKEVTVKNLSLYTGLDLTQCQLLLMNLSLGGFVTYESYRQTAIVKDKLYSYIKNNSRKQDYDVLRMLSTTHNGEPNAVINIYDMDLRLNGIETFSISDSHNVRITPYEGKITMQKDRSFTFNGSVAAGRFKMSGSNCKFDYDNFTLDLPSSDSLSFLVPSFEDTNTLVKIQTPIRKLDLKLVIDQSDNKSSIKKIDGYPMLSSQNISYVYYNDPKIQNGVYDSSTFYYKLEPFVIRNLFSFATKDIVLKGSFYSADIFAPINEPLVVMRDYSLGFKKDLDNTGLPIYNGKAQYYSSIDLSCNGLLGTGRFDFGSSKSESKMFVFHPDSMFCETTKFVYNDPKVSVNKTKETYYKQQNYMIVQQVKDQFDMYTTYPSTFEGYLRVYPNQLTGSGEIKTNEMLVKSDLIKYSPNSYTADSADFTLLALDGNSVAFEAKDVRSSVDYTAKKGEFTTKNGIQQTSLTYLQYVCFVDKFTWNIDSKMLSLQNSSSLSAASVENKELRDIIDIEQPGAQFVSTHETGDSLHFNAINAALDLNKNMLVAKGVYMIRCADAAIAPKDKQIILHPGALMDTIENANIVFNTETKYHEVDKARVFIQSGQRYFANGYIVFSDMDNNKSEVFFKDINSLNNYTTAKAEIKKDEALLLNKAFKFYGDLMVEAKDSTMSFDGGVALTFDCNGDNSPYLKFSSKLDADKIYIPISEAPTDVDGNRITTSILFNESNLKPQIAFLTTDTEADNVFLKAQGYLTYDNKKQQYIIASKEKLENWEENNSDYLSVSYNTCKAVGKGNIQLGFPVGSAVSSDNYGTIKVNKVGDEATIKMTLALSFPFSKEALNYMGKGLFEDMNLAVTDFENSPYKDFLYHKYGEEKAESLYQDLIDYGEWKDIPKDLSYSILLTDVTLVWDPIRRYYLSSGESEVAIIGDVQVNRKVKTKIQMIKSGISTEFRIYLEQDLDNWYYFTYNGASMGAISSDDNFNDLISNAKDKEFKAKNGKIYTFRLSTPSEKRDFIRKIELSE